MATTHRDPSNEKRVPQNPRLWAMLQNLAKRKFHPYPSIPASKWLHEEYVKRGGTFVSSRKHDTRHDKGGKETSKGKQERKEEEKEKEKTEGKKKEKD